MLDCLSGGRFIAGIVRGVPQEYVSYNVDPFTSHSRQREAYEIIQKCLTEELFDYEGKYWKVTNVSIWPKPVQRPLPFWMPAGSLESIEFAAEHRICSAQVFGPTLQFQENFDLYRKVAQEKFGWKADYSTFVGARLIHVAETNEQAIAEVKDALYYFFRTLNRPVINPAPLPGHASDKSYTHRKRRDQDVPGPNTPFEQMRRDGFIVCGDPEWVTRWLEEDFRGARYGHFLGMFHVGNLAHERVVKSKQLFARHVMPALKDLNLDEQPAAKPAAAASAYEVRGAAAADGGRLPLYKDFNYVLTRDSPEVVRSFSEAADGKQAGGWEMKVPEWGLDGFAYEIILVGPSSEMRGSAIRLRITDAEDREAPADAEVTVEVSDQAGGNRQVALREKYGTFAQIADQHAPEAAHNIGSRVVAPSRYQIRLTVAATGSFKPDPDAPGSFFEIECFKNWLNITA